MKLVTGMRLIAAFVCLATALSAGPVEVRQAEGLYRRTEYQKALQTITPVLGNDPAAYSVAGRAYFMLGDYKRAVESFEKAVELAGNSSEYHHWLGRAYGRRAETSMPLLAPRYASKARQEFETAVKLNSRNGEALNDLFDYYLQAPGFLGGGFDKALALLPMIKAIDPSEHEYALAQLAEARKEFNTAEQHLKRAADLAPKSVGRVLDVAKFLARQGRVSESFSWLGRAEKIDPEDPKVLFETAQTYIQAQKNLDTARTLLQQYLNKELNPDLPSRAEAQKLLRKASGD